MTEQLITRAEPLAVTPAAPSTRRLEIRLASWGEIAENTEEGIREQLLPGVFAGNDASRVTLESTRHGGPIVGVAEELAEREDGPYAVVRVAETPAGDELLALTRPGPEGEPPVLRDASVVFRPIKSRPAAGGIVQRVSAELRRIAIVERGAYPSASVVAVRSEAMSEITEQPAEAPAEPEVVSRSVSELAPIMGRLDQMDARMAQLATLAAVPGGALAGEPPELYRHETLADYAMEVWRGNADAGLLARALVERSAADQITANNPGVVPPAWLSDVKRIVDLGRRAITAFGGAKSLPSSGMELDWPYLNSSNTLVGAQGTEKTEVTSARVDIAKATADIVTYAGYSDISYQLLQRSSPSYRDAYDRILLAAWGTLTDAAFCTALEGATGTTDQAARGMLGADKSLSTSAASDDIIDCTGHGFSIGDAVVFTALTGGTGLTAGRVYWVTPTSYAANTFRVASTPGGAAIGFTADITAGTVAKVTDTGQRLHEALAQASVSVEDATGQPAGIVLAGTDMFLMLAGLSGIVPLAPSNAPGTMNAATLRVEVSGLTIQRAPGVSAGKMIVSNREVAAWHEDGPRFISAEDVAKLGQNVGVYSFSVPAVYVPAGVVELTLI